MGMDREGTLMGRDTMEESDTEMEEEQEEEDNTRLPRQVSSTILIRHSTMDKNSTVQILVTILIHLNNTPRHRLLTPYLLLPIPTTRIILTLNNNRINSNLNNIIFLHKGTDTEEEEDNRCEKLNLKVNLLPSNLNHRTEDGDTSIVS